MQEIILHFLNYPVIAASVTSLCGLFSLFAEFRQIGVNQRNLIFTFGLRVAEIESADFVIGNISAPFNAGSVARYAVSRVIACHSGAARASRNHTVIHFAKHHTDSDIVMAPISNFVKQIGVSRSSGNIFRH